jgi:hypothetical protein
MSHGSSMPRRQFLKGGLAAAGSTLAAPLVVPSSVLGGDGATPPSDKIILGAMGIGGRGGYDLGCMLSEPDVRCVAVCDARVQRRQGAKKKVDDKYGNTDCVMYRDYRELFARPDVEALLIATGNNWHGLGSILAAKAGKDVYCEKPCTRNIAESLELAATYRRTGRIFQGGMQRRNLPSFVYCIDLARRGGLGKLQSVHAAAAGMGTGSSGWGAPEPEPPKEEVDWDLYLGPAAWRPYSRGCIGGGFEKGGGMVGGGVLEWGSHCVDLCQWAADADDTVPVEYFPVVDGEATARYANGVKLVMRDKGWLGLGSCPVRFEGDTGWVETGDNGDIASSSPALLAGMGAKIRGYPANNHIREFFDCVRSRRQPRANAVVACNSHIACHAAGIAIFLNRKLTYDPKKHEFINDVAANRLRTEAVREPWRY